ncbi:MAG TPA: DinB family protein, partial [Acidobacteriota bacterium]
FANWIWLQRWKGTSPTSASKSDEELATFQALKQDWLELRSEVGRFVKAVTEERLQSPLPYKTMDGAPYAQILADQMQHVINHSSYHRGQLITMLRQLGAPGIGTDLISYIREKEG